MRVALLLLLVFGSIESYRIELYNNADISVKVQKMRNNVISNVTLPAAKNGKPSNWNMTGLGDQAFVVFVMGNLVAQIEPSQTPNSIDVSVRYLYDTFNTTLNQMVYFPGQSPGAPYSWTFLCNELYVPQQCLSTVGPNAGPSNFLRLTIPYDANLQPFKIYYDKPKGYTITLINDATVDLTVEITRNNTATSELLAAYNGRYTMTKIMPNEQISFVMENLLAFILPSNPPQVPPQVQFGVSYQNGPGMSDTFIGMDVYDTRSAPPIFTCNRGPNRGFRTCMKSSSSDPAKIQTADFPFGLADYEIKYHPPYF